jgi:hypothetical protein
MRHGNAWLDVHSSAHASIRVHELYKWSQREVLELQGALITLAAVDYFPMLKAASQVHACCCFARTRVRMQSHAGTSNSPQ